MKTHPASRVSPIAAPQVAPRPFLKWAGGKRRLLPQLLPLLPAGKRLVEPFVGAGSVFLATGYDTYLLNDSNADLIELFNVVKNHAEDVVELVNRLFIESNRSNDAFLRLRATFNETSDNLLKAGLFIYLNRFGFNGLCRYNKRGQLNTPYGKPGRIPAPRIDDIRHFAEAAQRAELRSSDFIEVMEAAVPGDVVYCDPPYVTGAQTHSSFTAYTRAGFGHERQIELVNAAKRLVARGIPVVISNHDTPVARQLYADAQLYRVEVRRSIAARSESRGDAAELIAVFSPSQHEIETELVHAKLSRLARRGMQRNRPNGASQLFRDEFPIRQLRTQCSGSPDRT